jgi:broad specificity phosphatase PhoE
MSTRVVLIEAGPTPWDKEDRLVGDSSLPLTAEAMDAIRHLLKTVNTPITAVYRTAANEACNQTAQIIAKNYGIRPRDSAELDEVALGLWQGLLPDEIRLRFPTVYPKWEEQPLQVTPPDGEPLEAAIQRIDGAIRLILRKNRNTSIAMALRPMAMQIAAGVLNGRLPAEIAKRLHHRQPIETIEAKEPGKSPG